MKNHSKFYQQVGNRMRELRVMRNLTQEVLAKNSGLSRTSVVNIECGRQGVPCHSLYRIAHALGVRIVDLFPSHANSLVISPIIKHPEAEIVLRRMYAMKPRERKLVVCLTEAVERTSKWR